MKPFKFTLHAARTVREREEQCALHEYVAALRKLDEAKRHVEDLGQELGAAWEEIRRTVTGGGAHAAEIIRVQDYCDMLLQRKRQLRGVLKAARAKANRAFARYLAAHVACAAVEMCHERQKRHHDHDRIKHEQKAVDDLAQRSLTLVNLVMRSRGTLWN